jgi:O-antigen/teichoic acid export membrane protein
MHALLVVLELFAHAFRKIFGPKLSAEEKKKQDEKNRREARRSLLIAATIILLASVLLVLAIHWTENSN